MANRTTQLLGLAILPVKAVPSARRYVGYNYAFQTWGGVGPFAWSVESGKLPPGLVLNTSTGAVSGTPTATGTYTFALRVTDSAVQTQTSRPRTFVTGPLTLSVGT